MWKKLTLAFGLCLVCAVGVTTCDSDSAGGTENCANRIDDDGDGVVDCVDPDCRDSDICQSNPEFCSDGLDNDLDGDVDCMDNDCAGGPLCAEDCGNGVDDDGNDLVDCDDPVCKGIDPRCGEVCGDGVDNDGDGDIDCNDADCDDVVPPCGGDPLIDGTICAYGEDPEHTCECADGIDNDGDGYTDTDDLHCFGPFDDDEGSYSTGIPGDNNGSQGNRECPFDGNSGTGNDDICCNLDNPNQNVTPNGCDDKGCCEIDVNGNGKGEHVYVSENCDFAPACGSGSHGCPCQTGEDCDDGQYCVPDDDDGAGFCSTCESCPPNELCENTCECGEICYGGFTQPEEECGGGGVDPTCPSGITACPNGDGDCNAELAETCVQGCCYARCEPGVIPCEITSDCPVDPPNYCVTGCCVEVPL
ncbi:MAG: hypothetical protein JRF33_17430 [Deltaproteobacteria bacterium]|nr:hypothetical protein [Deltaproteobacteria bacterium]